MDDTLYLWNILSDEELAMMLQWGLRMEELPAYFYRRRERIFRAEVKRREMMDEVVLRERDFRKAV